MPLTDDERELFITEDLVDYAAQIERDEGCPARTPWPVRTTS